MKKFLVKVMANNIEGYNDSAVFEAEDLDTLYERQDFIDFCENLENEILLGATEEEIEEYGEEDLCSLFVDAEEMEDWVSLA